MSNKYQILVGEVGLPIRSTELTAEALSSRKRTNQYGGLALAFSLIGHSLRILSMLRSPVIKDYPAPPIQDCQVLHLILYSSPCLKPYQTDATF